MPGPSPGPSPANCAGRGGNFGRGATGCLACLGRPLSRPLPRKLRGREENSHRMGRLPVNALGAPSPRPPSPAAQGRGRPELRFGRPRAPDRLPSPAQFAGEGLGMGGAGPSAGPACPRLDSGCTPTAAEANASVTAAAPRFVSRPKLDPSARAGCATGQCRSPGPQDDRCAAVGFAHSPGTVTASPPPCERGARRLRLWPR
jgi:hypothetical protein